MVFHRKIMKGKGTKVYSHISVCLSWNADWSMTTTKHSSACTWDFNVVQILCLKQSKCVCETMQKITLVQCSD